MGNGKRKLCCTRVALGPGAYRGVYYSYPGIKIFRVCSITVRQWFDPCIGVIIILFVFCKILLEFCHCLWCVWENDFGACSYLYNVCTCV